LPFRYGSSCCKLILNQFSLMFINIFPSYRPQLKWKIRLILEVNDWVVILAQDIEVVKNYFETTPEIFFYNRPWRWPNINFIATIWSQFFRSPCKMFLRTILRGETTTANLDSEKLGEKGGRRLISNFAPNQADSD